MKHTIIRIISCIVVGVLLAGCSPAAVSTPEATEAPQAQEKPLPEPAAPDAPAEKALPGMGDTLSGFTVKKIVPMDALGATGICFEHEKSGAELLYLACADTNRSFDISFRTPALDDKGKPHVFEHITISGSQKYPDANMFFPFANKTYSTFVNAMTAHGLTTYPVASLSEDQLVTMMDYYLSGVFSPLLYIEPRLAEREAWRYELTDADAELNIAGTVYSEMQGALTLSAQAYGNNTDTLYAGSTTAYESGGEPEAIRTLTYEELIAFHDSYYHPSNALITLYGDLDIARFLEYIDKEYLSGYEKKDIEVDMGRIEPFTETQYGEYSVAVEKDAATKDASMIFYSFALNGADLEDTLAMTVLKDVLMQESSPIMRALREKLPKAQISGMTDFDSPSAPYFSICAIGVDPADRDTFVAAVDEGLAALRADGMPGDVLDSVLAINKLALLTTPEDTNLGVNASVNIALCWAYFDDIAYYPAYEKVLEDMTVQRAEGLIKTYLTDNLHRAVSVTKPEAGLTEQNAAALAKELAEKKAALSAEEIDALVQRSAAFVEWANRPVSDDMLSEIANVDVAELPEELRRYDVKDETVDGVRYLSAAADVSGVFAGQIMLDGSTIPIEQLQDAQLCLRLLGQLGTKDHTKEELSTLITRYLGGFSATLSAAQGYDGADGYYAAIVSWIGLGEDAPASMALLKEMLLGTDFTDTATIKSLLTRWSSDFVTALDNSVLDIQIGRCAAMYSDYGAYSAYVGGYALNAHAQELIALADADPAALTARLEAAMKLLCDKTGATVLCAGGEDAIAAYQREIQGIFADMKSAPREKVDYSVLRIPQRSEGIVNNSTVQMNVLYGDYAGYSGKDNVIRALINDMYLLPQLRNALGAYGAYSSLSPSAATLYTYRDPNLRGSYDIFSALPQYLSTVELTQDAVDSYITGAYTSLSRPAGLLSGAIRSMTDKLLGCTDEMRLQWMKDAKAATAGDVAASADIWEALIQNGVRSSSGTESALLADGSLFDVLIYPDGTEKALNADEKVA